MYPTREELLKEVMKYNNLYSLQKYNIKRKLFKIPRDKTVFFFGKTNDLNYWVKEYYMHYYAEKFEIIDNILKDDDSVNYKVYYDIDKIEYIYNMDILYGNDIKVYNYLLRDILAIGTKDYQYQNYISQDIDISKQQEIFKKIIKEHSSKEKKAMKYLYRTYIEEIETYQALNNIICDDYRFNNFDNSMDAVNNAYNKRDEILRKILELPPNIKLKNTSELTLYAVTKKLFRDAIYQYRCEWLGKQSLDIFIPSRNIGIEYQGQQHYEAIDFFGGQEKLNKQQELDKRKRDLCKLNNIRLIVWKYTDLDFSEKNVLKKIINE